MSTRLFFKALKGRVGQKVCPVKNIILVDGKPQWLHRCEMCLACDEWCPQKAIEHWCKVPGKDYHHPAITLKEDLACNKQVPRV